MVLGGDDDVFHPGVLRELHPGVSVELGGIELPRELLVLLHRNLGAIHDPLAETERLLAFPFARRNGVKAPVDEHSVLRLFEPGKPRLARFGRIRIGSCLLALAEAAECEGEEEDNNS